jgi:hypothetical protein
MNVYIYIYIWYIYSDVLTSSVIKFMHLAIYITRLIDKVLVCCIHPILKILARNHAVAVILIEVSVQSHSLSWRSSFYLTFSLKKVKRTLVQALRLCTGPKAHRGSKGIALLFHVHSTRRGWEVSVTPKPLFTPGKTRYPLYRRLAGLQGRSGQVRKISPFTGIRSPDRPVRSQSLYRLRYPAHIIFP